MNDVRDEINELIGILNKEGSLSRLELQDCDSSIYSAQFSPVEPQHPFGELFEILMNAAEIISRRSYQLL